MDSEHRLRAYLWLRMWADPKLREPDLQRSDLERVCQQRGWHIIKVYLVAESVGKTTSQQFQAVLEDARMSKFDVLTVWSVDCLPYEDEWPVSRIIAALHDWDVSFYSYSEPFLDTTGPFAELLVPLFEWLARHEKTRAQGKPVGRPMVVDKVDTGLVIRLRNQGMSWSEIAQAHPSVEFASGRQVKPSVGSIRRAWGSCQSLRPSTP